MPLQPHTPGILEDMKAIESVMSEDETEQECCRGKFQEGDDNLFVSLLHFADHCLYKIVRWARNLPDFASVSVVPSVEFYCTCTCSCGKPCDAICVTKLQHIQQLYLHILAYAKKCLL